MATCLVTVSGTSGEVLIKYTDAGSVERSIIAGVGPFYLNDTGTDYTWMNLSGDASAASGCITLTEVVTTCYILSWEVSRYDMSSFSKYMFKSVVTNSDNDIDELIFPYTNSSRIGAVINNLNNPNIKAVGYKHIFSDKNQNFLILKVSGSDTPYLKIRNEEDTHYLYIKGEPTMDCLPAGYTEIETCRIGTSLP